MGLSDQSNADFPWAEYISRTGSTSNGTFAYGSGTRATVVMDVFWDDWSGRDTLGQGSKVLQELLGYPDIANNNNTNNPFITRVPPLVHPLYSNLYCGGIASVTGVKWLAKEEEDFGPFSKYLLARLALVFEAVPYVVIDDNGLQAHYGGQEWRRWTLREPHPIYSNISREQGSFKFSEGPQGPPNPQDFNGTLNTPLKRTGVRFTWFHVPLKWVLDDTDQPAKVDAAAGTVNFTSWYGYDEETLLLQSYDIVRVPSPFPVLGAAQWEPQQLVNVVLLFERFNHVNSDSTVKGWNTAPQNGGVDFYGIVGTVDGQPPYARTDFSHIFDHV